MTWDRPLPTAPSPEHAPRGSLALMVVMPDQVTTYPLSSPGTLIIGRAEEVDIHIHDPSISRKHAAVHFGEVIEIEDLGSAHGTRIQGRPISANVRTAIGP